MQSLRTEIAALAARLIVEEGLDYGSAKRHAARRLGVERGGADLLPGNAEIEAMVREEIALFHAETQPFQLHALRHVALAAMERFASYQPHVCGAVWHGTATALSDVHIDLFTDDTKAVEFDCIDLGLPYEAGDGPAMRGTGKPVERLSLLWPTPHEPVAPDMPDRIIVCLDLHPEKALRGALIPDDQGRTPRGSLPALRVLVSESAPKGTTAESGRSEGD